MSISSKIVKGRQLLLGIFESRCIETRSDLAVYFRDILEKMWVCSGADVQALSNGSKLVRV